MFPPAPEDWDFERDFFDAIGLVLDDATATGTLDRPVQIVHRTGDGPPQGRFREPKVW